LVSLHKQRLERERERAGLKGEKKRKLGGLNWRERLELRRLSSWILK